MNTSNLVESLNEDELQRKIKDYLSTWFDVEREVRSTKRKRIDLVCVHKSDKEKKYPFGIEVKVDKKKRGKDIANWFKQACYYTREDFVGYGRCIIITAPPVSGYYLEEGLRMNKHELGGRLGHCHHNVSTFLGQFGIGEMQRCNSWQGTGYVFAYNGSVFWNSLTDNLNVNMIEKLWVK